MSIKANHMTDAVSLWGMITVAALFLAGSGWAAPLATVTGNWPEANLRAALDPPDGMQVEQGSNFKIRITSDEEASVALILVNSESKAQVLIPHRSETADRVSRGTEMLFPDLLSGEALYADMPAGKATLYVLASKDPLFEVPPANAAAANAAPIWLPLDQVEAQLDAAMKASHDIALAIRRIPLQVSTPKTKDFVSTEEFVQFYGVGTRSVSNAERGFAVQFAFDSDELTDWGRRQLDAVAHGMIDDRLAKFPFLVEGHTDDVGSDQYNLSLSDRRAVSVRRYLVGQGVQAGRLDKKALGKSDPAVEGTSELARAANRRVVIRRLDSAH
jgi:outer membrane protein OmpA-like peptidoglycan-associated protein